MTGTTTPERPQDIQAREHRQGQLLAALANAHPDAAGWVTMSAVQLCVATGLAGETVKKARRELVAAGLIEWEPGVGHRRARYRMVAQ